MTMKNNLILTLLIASFAAPIMASLQQQNPTGNSIAGGGAVATAQTPSGLMIITERQEYDRLIEDVNEFLADDRELKLSQRPLNAYEMVLRTLMHEQLTGQEGDVGGKVHDQKKLQYEKIAKQQATETDPVVYNPIIAVTAKPAELKQTIANRLSAISRYPFILDIVRPVTENDDIATITNQQEYDRLEQQINKLKQKIEFLANPARPSNIYELTMLKILVAQLEKQKAALSEILNAQTANNPISPAARTTIEELCKSLTDLANDVIDKDNDNQNKKSWFNSAVSVVAITAVAVVIVAAAIQYFKK